ncbi:MAG TPA: HAD-IA family hydrolase [Pseudomonadales bacterium]
MIRGVLFDLDGTLLDTEPDFTDIVNAMLTHHGRKPVDGAMVRKFVSSGAMSVVRQAFALTDDDHRNQELLKDFLARYSVQIPQTRAALFDDVEYLLTTLHANAVPWGIMTNKARLFSEPLLTKFACFSTCATLVCPDDVGKGKPDPAGLLLACKQMALAPEDVLYVGDHPRDIEAAKNAGMPAAAIEWGYLPEDPHISAWGAQHIATTPRALLQLLDLRSDLPPDLPGVR